MPGLLDRALNYRIPLGEAQLGPGPMLGIRGPTVNNLLSPLTDVRGSDQMLPPDFSLAELGGLLSRLPQAVDPGALATQQVEAQTTPADPNQPYSALRRLVNLFPMVDAFAGGTAAPAVAKGSTTLGTYAGRKAAKADLAALAVAEARHAAGEAAGPASQIRQDTGWFKDAVGDWKWEFSDKPSKLTGKTGPTAADVLDHPEFFANYPRLAKAKVKIVDLHKMMGRPVNAAFHNQTGTIYLHNGLTPDEMRAKLQHELTHAVQKEENFATGSSTNEPPITTLAEAELAKSTNPKVQSYRALKKQIEAQRDAWIKKNIPQMGAKKATAAWPNIFPSEAQDLAGFTRALEGEAQNIRNRLYTNTFGEVEARDVEHRLNLDLDQRKASVPYVSQGVPESDYVRLRNDPGKPYPKVIPSARIVGEDLPAPLDTEGLIPVFPQPQRMLDPTSPDYTPGGRYLAMPGRTDITGRNPALGHISIGPDGKPTFKISADDLTEAPNRRQGATVKTNLIKQKAGWGWVERAEGVPDVPTLVSISTGGKHYYALAADYPQGVNLARYPDSPNEPRLRPTAYGDVDLGRQVGTISVRGREHPVYERAVVRPKGTSLDESIPPGADIPPGASATPPGQGVIEEVVFNGPNAMFQAIEQYKTWGGKGYGRVEDNKDGTWTAIREGTGPGALPPAQGGHAGLAGGVGQPGRQSLPPSPFMDRRGMPGRDPSGPRTPLVGPADAGPPVALTDPEGRPLYREALIAGQRELGGPDVPLTIHEEIGLNQRLGDYDEPFVLPGANGRVKVRQPGEIGWPEHGVPPTKPLLTIQVDRTSPADVFQSAVRHEGGHAIDYWTERTKRGANQMQQHPIPDDVRPLFEAASAEMRPDLWGPDAPKIYDRSEANLKEYRERPDELMADNYRYYKENPAQYKAKYPEAARYIRAMVNDDPLLSEHIQFNVQAGGPMAGLIQVPQEEGLTDADLLQVLGLGPLAPGLMAVAREAGRKATPKVTAASLKDRA